MSKQRSKLFFMNPYSIVFSLFKIYKFIITWIENTNSNLKLATFIIKKRNNISFFSL